jgi:hypothetical protein
MLSWFEAATKLAQHLERGGELRLGRSCNLLSPGNQLHRNVGKAEGRWKFGPFSKIFGYPFERTKVG